MSPPPPARTRRVDLVRLRRALPADVATALDRYERHLAMDGPTLLRVVIKTGEQPLTGLFRREHEELMVLLSNTVLNLAHPNHMREALLSRRVGMAGK